MKMMEKFITSNTPNVFFFPPPNGSTPNVILELLDYSILDTDHVVWKYKSWVGKMMHQISINSIGYYTLTSFLPIFCFSVSNFSYFFWYNLHQFAKYTIIKFNATCLPVTFLASNPTVKYMQFPVNSSPPKNIIKSKANCNRLALQDVKGNRK